MNKYDFINLDDHAYITDNLQIQNSLTTDSLRWAFTTRYFDLWNPMLWLSFMLDYQIHGLNAGGYHLTNLILHVLSTLLLFWLFHRMTRNVWPSAFVAAFFALHPLHVESVAWVSERKDTLSAFFWMLTLCFYVWYTEKPDIKRYLLALFCFALALMSKPMVITLPLILILLDYWPLKRFPFQERKQGPVAVSPALTRQEEKKNKSKKKDGKENMPATGKSVLPELKMTVFGADRWHLLEKIPFFILSIVLVIITFQAPEAASIQPSKHFPLDTRLANVPVSFITYLVKTFWPHDLAVFYPFPEQGPLWQTAVSVLLIIIISALIIAIVKRLPYLFTGWFWFMIAILPVIGILQISTTAPYAIADRYHYLPSIGLAFMLAWGAPSLIKNDFMRKKILFPIAIIFLGVLAVISYRQCAFWKNSETLFSHALQVTKDNYIIHNNLGTALFDEKRFEDALYHYNEAIRIKPDFDDAYYNRGNVCSEFGNNQLAIENFDKAIRLNSSYAKAYNNRGNSYATLGRHQLAIIDFNQAVRLKPDYADAYYNRATVYAELGENQQAIENYNEAIRLKPDFAAAYYNRGILYNLLGLTQPAIKDFSETILLKPDDVYAHYIRAVIYLKQGNKESGCWDAQKACELGNCKILKSARSKGYCR